jgi:hypothetical protein
MGYPTTRKDVHALMFDAECGRPQVFELSVLSPEKGLSEYNPGYRLDKYNKYAKFELAARDNQFLYEEVLKKGIICAFDQHGDDS